eukprot:TRINITY_DN42000_c0_g1_i4.p1 TRINITY_DN42000_c0_g1~~TRINITY_DN42000_c0_g1_i4.p1  ORF type:complete len:172 (+),score=18.68 TRINITY_DN42000_c0_g1_i4:197-712(+)
MPRASAAARKKDAELLQKLESHPVLRRLRSGQQKVVVLVGAGVSASAGIPDFRSPGTGLYYNLDKYDLPEPEAVFSLEFFRKNPVPFTLLAKELWPADDAKPTAAHLFVRLLELKGCWHERQAAGLRSWLFRGRQKPLAILSPSCCKLTRRTLWLTVGYFAVMCVCVCVCV